MKFTLKCEHYDYDIYSGKELSINNTVTHEFRAEELSVILENFESFLRGNGFYIDGNLDLIKDDWPENVYTSEIDNELDYDQPEANFNWPTESEQMSLCSVCKIDTNTMKNHKCYDKNCPKVN